MSTISIMQDIRELLSQGKSSIQIIALGHKPPTVYKVQRQIRQQDRGNTGELALKSEAVTEATPAPPQTETSELQQRIADLEAELDESESRLDEAHRQLEWYAWREEQLLAITEKLLEVTSILESQGSAEKRGFCREPECATCEPIISEIVRETRAQVFNKLELAATFMGLTGPADEIAKAYNSLYQDQGGAWYVQIEGLGSLKIRPA